MNIISSSILGLMLAATISGCASQPEKIQATYVSSTTYSNYSCKSIVSERNAIVNRLNEMNAGQKKKATGDAVATGVALVLFWPAAFALGAGSDLEPQIAALKGHYDALTAAGHEKGCF